jgi:hypothetical protein
MGATPGVTGVVRVGGGRGKTSVLIEITGKSTARCLESLLLELQRLARECGLTVKLFKTGKRLKKKAKKKK